MRRAEFIAIWFVFALALAALWPLAHTAPHTPPAKAGSVEWWEGLWAPQNTSLVKLPLSPLEQRFARQFPGQIGRFTDGRREWIVRVMDKPTRMLHPASDCFRGMGYTVDPPRVRSDGKGEHWRCFTATRKDTSGAKLKVCERIFDARGKQWTDASSWYWSALMAKATQASGPWWAVTQVERGE
ncbi:MAG: hypothetical protein HYS18_13015 [Burkholderiales bacterium]|nr:hypothetical protein [Burkholderiales bacterium]